MSAALPLGVRRHHRRGGAAVRVLVITAVVAVVILGLAWWKLPMVRDGVNLLVGDLLKRLG